jgi:antitoxin component YwqK of YwqJK toxin-antitoxin module
VVEWYPNGNKKLEATYKVGEFVEGIFTDYFDNGNMKFIKTYGLILTGTGKEIYYYSDGKKKWEGETKRRRKQGVWTYYYKGKTYKMNWKDDSPIEGKMISWVSKDTPPVRPNDSWFQKKLFQDTALWDIDYRVWKTGVRMTEVYQYEPDSPIEVKNFKEWNEDGELIPFEY